MSTSSLRVLLLGDMDFDKSHERARARVLGRPWIPGGLKHLQRFPAAAETAIANLETPFVAPSDYPPPMEGIRPHLYWGDPGADDLGDFVRLELGDWPMGRRPSRPTRNVPSTRKREL